MKRMIVAALCVIFFFGRSVGAAGSIDVIKVMTRNQYLGADLTPVILAQNPQDFISAAMAVLKTVAANDFPRRVKALAAEVSLTRPDVIGLQEVVNFTANGLNSRPPFVDHLQETLDALSALGLRYVVAGSVEHLDVTLPLDTDDDGVNELVRILDRDVILVKAGLAHRALRGDFRQGGLCGVSVPNPVALPPFPPALQTRPSQDGCTYSVVGVVNSPSGAITAERGFLGVDVLVGDRIYRVVNTHLEGKQPDPENPGSAIIQFLQAVELSGTLQATTPANRRLIVLGDFNSSPLDKPIDSLITPYQVLLRAGFADAWSANTLGFLDRDGFTCCQQAELGNKKSILNERIDLVFLRRTEPFLAAAVVTGRTALSRSGKPPYWASDHGGVFATLVFPH